jgi:Tfp pilus assembly protein PilO
MRRLQLLAIVVLLLSAGFYGVYTYSFSEKPSDIRFLDKEIEKLNEKLITAQILDSKLENVYFLFEQNLALSATDSLADDASMPFLNWLTETTERLEIDIKNIRPRFGIKKGNIKETPYDLTIRCTYKQFGDLMVALEKLPRIVKINEFVMKNGIERLKSVKSEAALEKQTVDMRLSTMTLIKSSLKRGANG